MNKADKIFKKLLSKILHEGYTDENPRTRYKSDGETAYSRYITQTFEEYDLANGELPLTSLRPIAVTGGIQEMLAIYQTQTNTQEGFEYHDVNWWSDWMNDQGDIGRAYSYNLESHRPHEMQREVVQVKRKIVDEEFSKLKNIPMVNPLEKSVDGKVYFEGTNSELIVVNDKYDKSSNGTSIYEVQFTKTGNKKLIRKNDFNTQVKQGSPLKDAYARTYYGVGYRGNVDSVNIPKELKKALSIKWESMMKRCYSKDGGLNLYKDVFVHQDWHSLEQFLRDVRYIPHYHIAKEDNLKGWDLDKDYFGANAYSKDTCVFLKHQENSVYSKNTPLSVKSKDGKFSKVFIEIRDASIYLDMSESGLKTALYRTERLTRGKYADYDFEVIYPTKEDDYLYRYELSRNQVIELLKGLKENPFSRRHMLSFFNWSNQDKKMLVECAFQTLMTVRRVKDELYLDATLIQRSSDFPIAGHLNQMQYVALQMMVAHECGMKVGKFARFTQNLHIYERDIEKGFELLKRPASQKTPKLILKADGKSFFDITAKDFELVDYEPVRPQLKFDIAL